MLYANSYTESIYEHSVNKFVYRIYEYTVYSKPGVRRRKKGLETCVEELGGVRDRVEELRQDRSQRVHLYSSISICELVLEQIMYLSISFRKSTPPQNRQLNILISNRKQ